jgi:hypothetical protein
MSSKPLKLQRYRYGTGPNLAVVDLEDSMQSVSVAKDISGKEDIQLAMVGSFEEPHTTFTPGDFVVLRDQLDRAWSWGRVSVVRSQLKRDIAGPLTHSTYAVMVQGWYDFLSRSKLHVLTTSGRASVGTMFNRLDWANIAKDLYQMYGQPAGAMLQYMLTKLLRIRLPESMGGGWFADEIPVVYDKATADKYAPEFSDIEPIDFGPLMPQLTTGFLNTRSSDVGSIVASMFLFETSVVELVPYLSTESKEITKLGGILGAQPVLVYRIKPFRMDPLYSAAVSKIHYSPEEVEKGYLDRQLALYDNQTKNDLLKARADARNATTQKLFDDKMFSQITFNPEPNVMPPLPFEYITSVSRQRSDGERMNASTISAIPSQIGTAGVTDVDYLALPVAIDNQIEEHGLRLRIARWNLYPENGVSSVGAGPNGTPIEIYYRAVAAQVMQFYKSAHLYETGSITMHFTHTLYAVESAQRKMSTYDKAALDLEPGRWFRTSFQGMDDITAAPSDEYYGYITAVSHSIQRMATGFLVANTQINFQRGHFAEMWELLNGVNVPLGEIDRPKTTGGVAGAVTGVCGNPQPAGVLDPIGCSVFTTLSPTLRTFNQGAPDKIATVSVTVPPQKFPYTYPSLVNKSIYEQAPRLGPNSPTSFPPWLRCWMLEATSVMGKDQAVIRAKLDQGMGITARPSSPLPAALYAELDAEASLYMIAAAAYVIECYWRARPGFQDARVRIHSLYRPGDNGFHAIWSAMDFSIEVPYLAAVELPGALQIWASLSKLAAAGRIPAGGRGVYLNVNPATGIQGTAPSEAGNPSKRVCGFPPGASSWTHYDIGGAFNIKRPGASRPNTWLATDWDGNGIDELTIGPEFTAASKAQAGDSGITDRIDQVFANISDPTDLLLKYTRTDLAPRCPSLAKMVTERKTIIDPLKAVEIARIPLRDNIRAYYTSYGLNDAWLHPVDSTVPSLSQVIYEVEPVTTAAANNAAAAAAAAALAASRAPTDSDPNYGDLYLYNNDDEAERDMVFIFGSITINSEEARVYMYRFAYPLFAENHVFIAKNNTVDAKDAYDYAWDIDYNPANKSTVLYAFGYGVNTIIPFLSTVTGGFYNNLYLVDPVFDSDASFQSFLQVAQRLAAHQCVVLYGQNAGDSPSLTPTQIAKLEAVKNQSFEKTCIVSSVVTTGATRPDRHLSTNTAGIAAVRSSGLVK